MTMENKLSSWIAKNLEETNDNIDLMKLKEKIWGIGVFNPHRTEIQELLVERQLYLENKYSKKY